MGRLGRPKPKKASNACFRLTEREFDDLRKIAVAENITMTDFIRQAIKRRKKRLKEMGQWPTTDDREKWEMMMEARTNKGDDRDEEGDG